MVAYVEEEAADSLAYRIRDGLLGPDKSKDNKADLVNLLNFFSFENS